MFNICLILVCIKLCLPHAENVVKEPSILVCNSVGGVVGLQAALDR